MSLRQPSLAKSRAVARPMPLSVNSYPILNIDINKGGSPEAAPVMRATPGKSVDVAISVSGVDQRKYCDSLRYEDNSLDIDL